MANDTDTDVEDASSDLGTDTGDQSSSPLAMPTMPATTGPATPPAQSAAPAGGALAGLGQLLSAGLGGQTQPVGAQVQQRHGGLLTGLAGVLLDGLASGMAPDAATAAQMPMIRRQQAMQMQQMQLQQQKMQEEMRLAPVREKLLLADTQMKLVQIDHAMQEMSEENQVGISDFQKKWAEKALSENRGEEVMEGTVEDVNKWMQDNVHNPDIMKMIPYPKQRDASGKVTKVALIKIHPEAMGDPIDTKLDLVGADGKPITIPVKIGAGSTSWQNAAGVAIVHGAIAAHNAELTVPKNPEQGLAQAINTAQQAGRDPKTDPAVQQWQDAIKAGKAGQFKQQNWEEWSQNHPGKTRMDFEAALAATTGTARAAAQAGGLSSIEEQVDALHLGVIAPSQLSKRAATFNQVISRFHQKYPGESLEDAESNFQAGKSTIKDFTSGQAAKNLTSINTSYLHLGQLSNLIDALGTGDAQLINRAKLEYQRQTGSPAPAEFGAVHQAVSAELARSLTGAAATVEETRNMNDMLSAAQSPQALRGAVNQIRALLGSKRDMLQQQFEKGKKGEPAFQTPGGATPLGRAVHNKAGQVIGYTTDGKTMTPVGAQ